MNTILKNRGLTSTVTMPLPAEATLDQLRLDGAAHELLVSALDDKTPAKVVTLTKENELWTRLESMHILLNVTSKRYSTSSRP